MVLWHHRPTHVKWGSRYTATNFRCLSNNVYCSTNVTVVATCAQSVHCQYKVLVTFKEHIDKWMHQWSAQLSKPSFVTTNGWGHNLSLMVGERGWGAVVWLWSLITAGLIQHKRKSTAVCGFSKPVYWNVRVHAVNWVITESALYRGSL